MNQESTEKLKLATQAANSLKKHLKSCDICPRNCKANRLKEQRGFCGASQDMVIYSAFLHRGEEPGISGEQGSGTIFFSGCNLKCIYCQNYKFSHAISGKTIALAGLAKIMLNLQQQGAHNINLVTPTHFLPQILETLVIAWEAGLNLPIVYNTSGYEKETVIKQLSGIIDIYLTDLKYLQAALAKDYSQAPQYPLFAFRSLLEMARQVKPLTTAKLLKKGVVIRHLVLPSHIPASKALLAWIKKNTPQVLISLMFQYQPYFMAYLHPRINRLISRTEYLEIKNFVQELGLEGWVQDHSPKEDLAGPYFEPNV